MVRVTFSGRFASTVESMNSAWLTCAFVDLLRAVVSNQTLVWKYESTCLQQESSTRPCSPEPNQTLCQQYMHIHSWIPSYDVWKEWIPRLPNSSTFPFVPRVMENSELTPLNDIVDMLYEEGKDYLYGLLFYESVRLGSWWDPGNDVSPRDPTATSVLWYDDSKQEEESSWQNALQCLEPVLSNTTCQILFVKEEDEEVSSHEQAILNRFPQCTLGVLAHVELPKQLHVWQSLQLTHDPMWSAFVGPPSSFLRESIVFHRRQVVWKLGRIPPSVPELFVCDGS